MSRIADVVVPRRLGTSFPWLMGSSWLGNLGDGIALAAGPLLVASLTDQPLLVALAAAVVWAPPLLFALLAGTLTDRLDRRRIVVATAGLRCVLLALLALSIWTDVVTVWWVLGTLFLLGSAEVFADNAAVTMAPMLVDRDDLATAQARLQTGLITGNQLAGPPVGALLFGLGAAWPALGQLLLLVASVLLLRRVVLPPHGVTLEERSTVRHDVAEGFRWVARHPAVRTLALTIFVFNLTFGAAWSVLVLYATERLGLGELGFGLVTTVGALGGLVGTASYGWITRRVSLGNLMRIGLVVETLVHLALALTTVAWVGLVVFFVFGAHAFIWGTTSVTVRQRAVPTRLQGRVGGVYLVAVFGGLVVGSAIGGVLAQHYGVTAPFWYAFVGSAVFVVVIWRQLRHIAHADAQPGPAGLRGHGGADG